MPLFGRRRTEEPLLETRPERAPLPPPPDPGPGGLRSMVVHRDYLLRCLEELPPFPQQILDVLGLRICEDVTAGIDLPRFDNSAMDGYAVRAADVVRASPGAPIRLPVVGEVAAGQTAGHPLSPGTAIKIMTGAPVPPTADAIVPYENSDRGADEVQIFAPSQPGQHIRRIGEDVTAGTQVFQTGDRLGARDIGLLAAIGLDKVLVRPRPRVVVIATGTELVDPGRTRTEEQQIFDSTP